MDRKQFLKSSGGLFLAALAAKAAPASENGSSIGTARNAGSASPDAASGSASPDCVLSPSVNEGPFYLSLDLLRQDITGGRPGIPLAYAFTVLDDACKPVQGALVDIWQCDKDGVYSGYAGQANGASTVGETFLRGVQATDSQGQARFTSIYPGWYPNRLTHLHVKIHIGSDVVITTNLFYPEAINEEVYATADYKQHGPNPTAVANDIELHGDTDRYQALMLRIEKDGKGGYAAGFSLGINAPSSSLGAARTGLASALRFDRPFPNPARETTTLKYAIAAPSEISLEIRGASGALIERRNLGLVGSGEHTLAWNRASGKIPPGIYTLHLTALSPTGTAARTRLLRVE
jgi:protocatechuate 3,4-dioxygenase beta subunit